MTMDTMTRCRPIEILLVEDNPGDVRLTMEALKEGKVRNSLHVVEDGEEAMAFLRRQGHVRQGAPPGPDPAGPEPAQEGRPGGAGGDQGRPGLEAIPVVVLTTSRAEEDIAADLRPARQLLHHQAGGPGPVHRRWCSPSKISG